MYKKERKPIDAFTIIKIIGILILLYIVWNIYDGRQEIKDVFLSNIYWIGLWMGAFIGYRVYISRINNRRTCTKCGVPINTYHNTIFCLRWNSGREPTPLFFCLDCAREYAGKPYKGNHHHEAEDNKTAGELLDELDRAV